MKKYIIGLALLCSILPYSLFAYTIIDGQEQLRIENNIDDNLYVAGGKVDITGNISGDLGLAGGELMVSGNIGDNAIVTGGNIETSGTIGGDLIIAGGDIQIKNVIFGDIKAAGGKVTLAHSASGDVNIAAGDIRINKDVIIGRDLGVAGGNITINGLIRGKADIFAGSLDFDGVITGDVSLRLDDVKNLHIGPNAKIMGKLTYKSQEPIPALEKIAVGGAIYAGIPEFSHNENNETMLYGFITGYMVYRLLFLLIIGSILLGVFPNFTRKTAEILRKTPGKSFLSGSLYFILMPIIAILCFITVIGIPLGFFTLAVYVFSFVFAKVITLVVVSKWITVTWSEKISKSWQKWGIFILLAIVLTITSGIDFIATIFVFGALIGVIGTSFSKKAIEQ